MFNSNIPKICGGIVLYHPDESVLQNIQVLCKIIEKVFVIDNTEKEHFNNNLYSKLKKIDKVEYTANYENFGIARALNQTIRQAQKQNYEFLLTLDQDSNIKEDYLFKVFECLDHAKIDVTTIGIISPFHRSHPDFSNFFSQDVIDKQIVMTSGNLLNIQAVENVGEFWEDLFIDRVDHEYCLRLQLHGYRVIQLNPVTLEHGLGHITKHKLFNKNYYTTNHSALRQYYLTRNMFHVIKKYKDHFPGYVKWEKQNLISTLKLIMVFEKNKIDKFKMIFKGYCDYKNNIFGKFHEKN